jgi:hypothetical protein
MQTQKESAGLDEQDDKARELIVIIAALRVTTKRSNPHH